MRVASFSLSIDKDQWSPVLTPTAVTFLEVGLPVVDRMTVAAEFECSLQSIFVSLACVAGDKFEVSYYFFIFMFL